MTIAELQKKYRDSLSKSYQARESRNITEIVFESVLELKAHQLTFDRLRILTSDQQEQLDKILVRLCAHEPVQYVLGKADFFGMKFNVNPHVLIPRPETEELVEWILGSYRSTKSILHILDIGTGSGCIAIALAKHMATAKVEALDVSEKALETASRNSTLNNTLISFLHLDILSQELEPDKYDLIVSNPPYISLSESGSLAPNVLEHEPALALFAPSEDDLLFYRVIAHKSLRALRPRGALFFEIHEKKGEEIVSLLSSLGYKDIELSKDLSGKQRMVKAQLS